MRDADDAAGLKKKLVKFSRKILIRHKSSNMCITNEFRLVASTHVPFEGSFLNVLAGYPCFIINYTLR